MTFTVKAKHRNKMSLSVVSIIQKQRNFTTNSYRKVTFNGAYTHVDSLLHNAYKFGMTIILLKRTLWVYSDFQYCIQP